MSLQAPANPEAFDSKEPKDFDGDKVGVWRYILSFVMLGPPGLLIAYWARYYGWRAIWICAAVLIVLFAYGFGVGHL